MTTARDMPMMRFMPLVGASLLPQPDSRKSQQISGFARRYLALHLQNRLSPYLFRGHDQVRIEQRQGRP